MRRIVLAAALALIAAGAQAGRASSDRTSARASDRDDVCMESSLAQPMPLRPAAELYAAEA